MPLYTDVFSSGPNRPLAHELPLHATSPVASAYSPDGHAVHVAAADDSWPTGPYLPAAQPEPEELPTPSEQSDEPCWSAKRPEGHTAHVAASCDVRPNGPNRPRAHELPLHVASPATSVY